MWYFFSNATRSHKSHADFFLNVSILERRRAHYSWAIGERIIRVQTGWMSWWWLGLLVSRNLTNPCECWMALDWLKVSLFPVKPLNGVLGTWWCLHSSLANIKAGGLFVPLSLSYTHLPIVFWGGKDGVPGCFLYVCLIAVWGHSVLTACCCESTHAELLSRQGWDISFEEFCTLSSLPRKSEAPILLSESIFIPVQFPLV